MLLKKTLSRHLFRPAWYSIIINPYFIIRRGLLRRITTFSRNDFSGKKILDVGCGIKPYRDLFSTAASYIGIDIQESGHRDSDKMPDKFYDGTNIPFAEDSFDCVICTEVLEHVPDPQRLLKEIARVLKSDGTVFLTMPFVWAEHESPFDFQRFTRYKHLQIFQQAGFSDIILTDTTGVFRVCGQLISAFAFERLFPKSKVLKSFTAVLICFPIQVFFIILDTIFKNSWITLNYSITAKKKS